jgi:hypothetical protein
VASNSMECHRHTKKELNSVDWTGLLRDYQ